MKNLLKELLRNFSLAATPLLLIAAAILALMPLLPLLRMPLERERRAVLEARKELRRANEENQRRAEALSGYWLMRRMAIRQPEENVAVFLRERIENAATKAGLLSRTMGNVRRVELTSEAALYEVSFSADGKIGEVVEFLVSLSADTPRVYWRTLTIKSSAGGILSLTGTMCALNLLGGNAE